MGSSVGSSGLLVVLVVVLGVYWWFYCGFYWFTAGSSGLLGSPVGAL